MFKLGVLGKDIGYSLSPKIHLAFAKQLNHPIEYLIYDVDKDPISFIRNFFSEGGFGLNIITNQYCINLTDEEGGPQSYEDIAPIDIEANIFILSPFLAISKKLGMAIWNKSAHKKTLQKERAHIPFVVRFLSNHICLWTVHLAWEGRLAWVASQLLMPF